MSECFDYTVNWFSKNIPTWTNLLGETKPQRILEIGSFEGRSTCFLIDYLANNSDIEIHCIDTWEGGIEHHEDGMSPQIMSEVERRFHHNVKVAIKKAQCNVKLELHKGFSDVKLANMISMGFQNYFDLVYVDGSHQAPDVLIDAVLSFKLTKIGGLIFFDDYLWEEKLRGGTDILRCPKPAIDAFTNIFIRKVKVIRAPLYQLYVKKIAD